MRAIVQRRYGSSEVLGVEEVDKPEVTDGSVLIRVHAASVNPLDWHRMTGLPYVARIESGLLAPKRPGLGRDVSGRVEAVGQGVTEFTVGEAVFGGASGSFAEYALGSEKVLAPKPENLTFEEAAAVPVAALTALQGLRDHGNLQAGQSVLVNGASGGVGTFAIQIAKILGADVTGVCSAPNVEMVRSLGADHVIDYTSEDFTASDRRYDVFLDNIGNRSASACRQVLVPTGTYVIVGGPKTGKLFGPVTRMMGAMAYFKAGSQTGTFFISRENREDLMVLHGMLSSNQLKPVIGRRFGLTEVPQALDHLGTGHTRGKSVVTIATEGEV